MFSFYKHFRTNKVNEEMKNMKIPTDEDVYFVEGSDSGFYKSFDEVETGFNEIKEYDIVYRNGRGGVYIDGIVNEWEGSIGQAITKILQTFDELGDIIYEFNGEVTDHRAFGSNRYTQSTNIETEFGDFLVVMNLNVGSLNYDVRQFSVSVFFDDIEVESVVDEAKNLGISEALEYETPIEYAEIREDYDYVIPFKFMSNTNFSEAFGSDEDNKVNWRLLEDVSIYDEDLKEQVEEAREEGNQAELVKRYNDKGIKRKDIRPHIDDFRETLVDEYRKTIKFVGKFNNKSI